MAVDIDFDVKINRVGRRADDRNFSSYCDRVESISDVGHIGGKKKFILSVNNFLA